MGHSSLRLATIISCKKRCNDIAMVCGCILSVHERINLCLVLFASLLVPISKKNVCASILVNKVMSHLLRSCGIFREKA